MLLHQRHDGLWVLDYTNDMPPGPFITMTDKQLRDLRIADQQNCATRKDQSQ